MRNFAFTILAIAAAGAAQTETATPQLPAFDVASIRSSQGGEGRGQFRGGPNFLRGPIQITPDSVIARGATLKAVIAWANAAKEFQVTGPDWLGSERFDIVAKAAVQSTEDRLRAMMRTLLADRFKLTQHQTSKEMQAYVLVLGKGGSKLVESASEGESEIEPDRDKMQLTILRTPMSQLIDLLYNVLRTPIVDETGLKGRYDLNVNVAKYAVMSSDGAPDPIGLIQTALQEELGLKMESRKMPIDLFVIDRVEKAATEN
jgi:uncharacterized protein (TIGR03435 family)